jgi:hypoxanthine-guanine phosphoribosyltransferase
MCWYVNQAHSNISLFLQIVEDLIDTGLTMEKLVARLNTEHPKSIRVATMAVKRVAGNHGYFFLS